MEGKKLTPKQERFVEEYLIDLNATAAARRAGYSERTADRIGPELLGKTWVAQAIQKAKDRRSERTEITQDMVLRELARLAFVDIRKFYDENGSLKSIHDLDDDSAAALAGMELSTTWKSTGEDGEKEPETTKKIKTWDKKGALELLGKHFGMFEDRIKHSGGLSVILDFRRKATTPQVES